MNPPCVIIRVDGSSQIGMGHVVRCIRVAKAISDRIPVNVAFVTKTPNALDCYQNDFPPDFSIKSFEKKELDSIIDFYNEYSPQVIISDTNLGSDIDRYILAVEKFPLHVNIHEMHFNHFPFGLVVFASILPIKQKCACETKARYLTGAKYVLVDPKLADIKPPRFSKEIPSTILISMGGADPENQTSAILTKISEINPSDAVKFKVVIGPANANFDRIKKQASGIPNVEIIEPRRDILDLIVECDLAITNAGTTAYEVLAAGRPSWLLPQNEFEEKVASLLHAKKAILGFGMTGLKKDFLDRLDSLSDSPSELASICSSARKLIDAKGVTRLSDKISSALKAMKPG